ncbi:hypothetical protein WR25_23292 [Diploscapter pachys]|uniref:Uncharacterized protein n=1 Tax=Diploscapter pachys TaxID=2018661 RepID=A0A2A2J791_9BILA|nr:hypothetical protein WR25_23292 [Diploscapter pachys]
MLVITGGTDGIGLAYLTELAQSRGLKKFYLIGRSEKKLQSVAASLKEKHKAEVRYTVFDFESTDYSTLNNELKNLDVGILINCAGIAPTTVGTLAEQEPGLASKILQVNLMSNVKLTEITLPGMVERKRGIIVNFSSITGWRPLPYLSSYPASKAAISFFSDSLQDEFRGSGIRIQCLVPSLVATKIASYDTSEANGIFVLKAENFAQQAVRLIGTRWEMITGCVQHDMLIALAQLLSPWLLKNIFVPLIMLKVHKQRVEEYQEKLKNKSE